MQEKNKKNLYEERPWGNFEILSQFNVKGDGNRDVCVKRITVKPGARLSYQSHKQRGEHWFFVQGEGVVVLNDSEHKVVSGSSAEVPVGVKHRVVNTSDSLELIFIEVGTGHFNEEDITRFEDDFGRAGE